MKFSLTLVLGLATAGTLVAAQPHNHRHRHVARHAARHHLGKRAPAPGVVTVTEYRMDNGGTTIPTSEATQAVKEGRLAFDAVQPAPPATSSTPDPPPAANTPGPSKPIVAAQFYDMPANSSVPVSSPTSSIPTTSSSISSSSVPSSSPSQSASNTTVAPATGQGVGSEFPDGELDCGTFPSDYGAVALNYLGLGGWSGIQSAGNYANVPNGGGTCSEGDYCSYACPAGYQKSQWPSPQPASGQSVGGIQCSGGKLKLTNPGLSKNLCVQGNGKVKVQNNLSGVVSICRTDYPGTEGETIPLQTEPGQEYDLTCPIAEEYYSWQGGQTSAQYYINPMGATEDEACQWGSQGSHMGNFAPVNLGVGQAGGNTFISLMANKPTESDASGLDFTIEIIGGSAPCKYSNGQFTGATGTNGDGCTVQVSELATYVLSSS